MSENKNEHVVIAFYASKEAAELAVNALKEWDQADKEIKLGAIGLIYKEDGEIKTESPRSTGRGLAVGAVLGVFAAALGPVGLIAGAVSGGALGGVIGAFFKRSVDLDEATLQEVGAQLDAGKFGVVVAVDEFEMTPTAAQLANSGGAVQQFTVPSDALHEVAQIIPQEYNQGFEARRSDLDSAQIVASSSVLPLT
jgi:uncharacterized membrane protein